MTRNGYHPETLDDKRRRETFEAYLLMGGLLLTIVAGAVLPAWIKGSDPAAWMLLAIIMTLVLEVANRVLLREQRRC